MTELHFLTIAQASALIRARKLSPVDLTRACLARTRMLDHRLNSHLLLLEEQAMADARRAEADIAAGDWKGPLHGIPIALKDLFYLRGVRNTNGSMIFDEFIPEYNAAVVDKLEAAGAVLLGKLNMHELA